MMRFMRKFISISVLSFLALPMMACLQIETYNHYLFNLYDKDDFRNRVQRICDENWKAYLGMGDDEWFWFDADKVAKAAQAKNDVLMVSYVNNLKRYLRCADDVSGDQWDYPDKQQLAQRKTALESIRTYAQSKLKTRLRSQHALLFMRCNMLLKRHAENVSFWETTASQYIETVYKDMMQNIYAGALYKTGQEARAGEMFAEQGDYQSLMTIYYLKRSCAAIRTEYVKNPNARVLPFLLQDFVNNAQEADDAIKERGMGGKLFIRDITKEEALQMIALCQQVINEQKTESPAMWLAAKAWLEYMFANQQQSLTDIRKAVTMQGTERMTDCARVLRLYIEGALSKKNDNFDNWAEHEMQWLYDKGFKDGKITYDFYYNAYSRIVQQVLNKKYEEEGRPEVTLALYKSGHYPDYTSYIDTVSVNGLQKYIAYEKSTPKTGIERFLLLTIRKMDFSDMGQDLNDLMGTKYLRICQWAEAAKWLSKVPVDFYNKQGYAPYAALRKTTVEPWIKRQWLSGSLVYGDHSWTLQENPKLAFAQKMQTLEGELNVLTGKAREQRCYDLAVRYAQVNFTGDCWFIMRNMKSPGWDHVQPNETDLGAKALQLLKEASMTTDLKLKERALFALCYGDLLPNQKWYEEQWNSQKGEYDVIPHRESGQWRAFAQLAEFEKKNTAGKSQYVSKCDEYYQFCKFYH